MIQQKQQKNTRTQNSRQKDQGKIGFLAKKTNFPPIKVRSSSRPKLSQSLDQVQSHKKHKISDIFYEEIQHKKPEESKMNSIIVQKDSILQHSSLCQEDKQQTVIKMHEKRKSHEDEPELCNFHHNKLKIQVQKEQKLSLISSRMRAHQCCETQPSESRFHKKLRLNMFFNRNLQSSQKLKNSNLKTPEKLKPIKFNQYQKPQLFDSHSSKNSSAEKASYFKGFLSPIQAKVISDKLSQPKCTTNCGKRNCQCFDESSLKKISPFKRSNNHMASQREIALKKLNININRLKIVENQQNAENQDQQNFKNLRKRINEKKTWRKNMKLKQIKRFDTQVIDNEKFFHESSLNQNKTQQKDLSSSKMSEESDTLFKDAISPVKNKTKKKFTQSEDKLNKDIISKVNGDKKYRTIEKDVQNQPVQRKNSDPSQTRLRQQTNQNSRAKSDESIKTQIQEQKNIPSGIKNHIKNHQKEQQTQLKNKISVSSNGQSKLKAIGYTFGNSKESQNPQSSNKKKQVIDQKNKFKKTKKQKQQSLNLKIQYWIEYDIENNQFIDNLNPKQKKVQKKKKQPKNNLVSAVVKQTIEVRRQQSPKPIRQSQSTNTHEGSQVTVHSTIEPISQAPVPDNIATHSPQKSQIQLQSRILGKSRNCASSRSNKHSVNMFNRSPKSLTSTRSKQYFNVPKVEECVEFVKNYKPENTQINMQKLVRKQTFKVLPSQGKLFFGQITDQNVKHGYGIQITPNEIFEGTYQNGNKKNGLLKQHDGVYEGSFQNNLRHGYGIFKWNDGQIFKGQWRMGTKNGYGVWTGIDGSYYQGEWHLSMQHGKGKFVHFTSTYEGQFKNFYKQGMGIEKFPNGDVFKGEYKNGKPNGKGKYQWKDGTYYEGNFLQGLRDGLGKWHQNSNSFYEGKFKQDNKHGKGVEYYKDGSYFQGQFIKGQISKGTLYNSRRQVIKKFTQKLQAIEES